MAPAFPESPPPGGVFTSADPRDSGMPMEQSSAATANKQAWQQAQQQQFVQWQSQQNAIKQESESFAQQEQEYRKQKDVHENQLFLLRAALSKAGQDDAAAHNWDAKKEVFEMQTHQEPALLGVLALLQAGKATQPSSPFWNAADSGLTEGVLRQMQYSVDSTRQRAFHIIVSGSMVADMANTLQLDTDRREISNLKDRRPGKEICQKRMRQYMANSLHRGWWFYLSLWFKMQLFRITTNMNKKAPGEADYLNSAGNPPAIRLQAPPNSRLQTLIQGAAESKPLQANCMAPYCQQVRESPKVTGYRLFLASGGIQRFDADQSGSIDRIEL